MKKATLFVIVMFATLGVCSPVAAQGGDVSIWTKMVNGGGGPEVIPWITYDTGEFFLETRSNFDWKDAFTLFVGKSYHVGRNSATIIPELGMIWGQDYKSITPQLLGFGKFADRFSWTGMQQFSFGNEEQFPDFMYHWVEILYEVSPLMIGGALKMGISEQVYWEFGTDGVEALVDIGPVIRAEFLNNFYVKFWGTVDPNHHEVKKLFVGLGRSF